MPPNTGDTIIATMTVLKKYASTVFIRIRRHIAVVLTSAGEPTPIVETITATVTKSLKVGFRVLLNSRCGVSSGACVRGARM